MTTHRYCGEYISKPLISINKRSQRTLAACNRVDYVQRKPQQAKGALRFYPGLTHINLFGPQSHRHSAAELISVLEQCPRLEVFSLSNLDVAVAEVQEKSPVIQLSQIRKFELEGISPIAIAFILDRVYIPLMAPLLSNCGAGHAQSLGCAEIGYAPSLQVNARRVTLCGAAPDVSLALSDSSKPSGSASSIIGRLGLAVDISQVTRFQYQDEQTEHRAPAVDDWTALLASMRSINAIELDAPNQHNIILSIIVALTPDKDLLIDDHPCPQLRHLHLNLSRRQDASDLETLNYCLLRCLRIRRELGYANLGISVVMPHAEGLGGNAAFEQLKALADYVHFSVSMLRRH
jgi:hypothetical protein